MCENINLLRVELLYSCGAKDAEYIVMRYAIELSCFQKLVNPLPDFYVYILVGSPCIPETSIFMPQRERILRVGSNAGGGDRLKASLDRLRKVRNGQQDRSLHPLQVYEMSYFLPYIIPCCDRREAAALEVSIQEKISTFLEGNATFKGAVPLGSGNPTSKKAYSREQKKAAQEFPTLMGSYLSDGKTERSPEGWKELVEKVCDWDKKYGYCEPIVDFTLPSVRIRNDWMGRQPLFGDDVEWEKFVA